MELNNLNIVYFKLELIIIKKNIQNCSNEFQFNTF